MAKHFFYCWGGGGGYLNKWCSDYGLKSKPRIKKQKTIDAYFPKFKFKLKM